MPEEGKIESLKAPKTKRRLIADIIRWFSAIFFVVLLILAIVFQSAWKITALFAILAAGLTMLPRLYRKWFYACLGAIVLAIITWVFLPDDNEGWRPYTFDKETAALNAKYYVPDEENAAVIYNQLPEIFDDPCVAYIFEDSNAFYKLTDKPWLAEGYPKHAKWLESHQDIINLLLQTNQYDRCYFGTKANVIMDDSLYKTLSPARRAAQLLVLAANYDIGQNKFDECLDKYKTAIQIGNHFQQNPSTIHKLVGIAIEALAIGGLRQFIIEQDATADQIKQAETITSKADCSWNRNLPQIIEYEKLFLKNSTAYYYEISQRGRIRFARDPWSCWREYYKKELEIDPSQFGDSKEHFESFVYPSYWQKKLWKANTFWLWLIFPSNPQAAGKIIDEEYKTFYEMLKPDYDWQKEPDGPLCFSDWFTFTHFKLNFNYYAKIMAQTGAPNYRQLHRLYLRIGADKRGTLLLAALKRYKNKTGSWPDNLSQVEQLTTKENLIDPLSNGPFIYKLDKDGFLLYSIGLNGIDDHGKRERLDCSQTTGPDEYKKTNIGADDWLIWPPTLNSNDEEETDPNDDG
jgi:hypothetical protein